MNYCQPEDFFCQEPRLSVVLGIAVDDYWLKNSSWESLFQIITEIMTTYKSNLVSIMQAEIRYQYAIILMLVGLILLGFCFISKDN